MLDVQKLREEFEKAAALLASMPPWFQTMRARRLAYLQYIANQKNL
jgi:hypothetical protein